MHAKHESLSSTAYAGMLYWCARHPDVVFEVQMHYDAWYTKVAQFHDGADAADKSAVFSTPLDVKRLGVCMSFQLVQSAHGGSWIMLRGSTDGRVSESIFLSFPSIRVYENTILKRTCFCRTCSWSLFLGHILLTICFECVFHSSPNSMAPILLTECCFVWSEPESSDLNFLSLAAIFWIHLPNILNAGSVK